MKERLGFVVLGALLFVSCSELKKDLPAPVASGIQVHDAGWSNPADPGFHGQTLKSANWDDASCLKCHGSDYTGGTSGVSCFKCHPPYPHSVTFTPATGRHVGYLHSRGYPLSQCQTCHGASYTGGAITNVSCEQSGCHADASGNPKSPESCNTCHGTFRASASLTGTALLVSSAPPKSVAGDTATTSIRVGAHQKHLSSGTLGKALKCQECHTVPASVFSGTHPKQDRASVAFNDTLASLATGKGTITPTYDPALGKCSNTYCHGNWVLRRGTTNTFVYTDSVMVGANAAAVWTGGSSQAACNSCHGTSGANPTYYPQGHLAVSLTACSTCHGDVTDATGKIVNQAKHINGWIDLVSSLGGPRKMQ